MPHVSPWTRAKDRGPSMLHRGPMVAGVAMFLTGAATWGFVSNLTWPLPAAVALTVTGAGLSRKIKIIFHPKPISSGERASPNPDPLESNPDDGGFGMAKPERKGRLAQVPQERLDRYKDFNEAELVRIQTKARKLVGINESHRRNGSLTLNYTVQDVIHEGFLRVLYDPEDADTSAQFMLKMFRQMEGFLTEQRRRASSDPKRHEQLDAMNPQEPSKIIVLPQHRPDEEYMQRRMLEIARECVRVQRPRLLRLFDLSRRNLTISEIAEELGRTKDQVSRDRYELHQFLTNSFKSGEEP